MDPILAKRLAAVPPSPTMTITAKAAEMRAAGRNIISLGAGEPDFPTPEPICAAAVEAIAAGQTKYTPVGGTLTLKKAIAAKFKRENGLEYELNEVTASAGAKQVLYNCLQASLDPGDEVLIPAPYWVSYPAMVELAAGKAVIIPTDGGSHKLTPAALKASLTPKSKWLMLNSPSNPSGAVYSRSELAALAEVAAAHPRLNLLSDDIYEHIVYEGEFATIAEVAPPPLAERMLIVNGVSKAYAMTGWRLGYGASKNTALIKAMEKLQSQSSSNPSSVSQAAAAAALDGDQSFLAERTARFKQRRDAALKILGGCRRLECETPSGAFYLFVKCDLAGSNLKDDIAYAAYLLEEAEVAVVPGTAFGVGGYFRLSYALADDALATACERIVAATDKLPAGLPA